MFKLTVQGNVECKLNGSLDYMVMVPMQMGVCVGGGGVTGESALYRNKVQLKSSESVGSNYNNAN